MQTDENLIPEQNIGGKKIQFSNIEAFLNRGSIEIKLRKKNETMNEQKTIKKTTFEQLFVFFFQKTKLI
ncbi:hypothetical protein DERF_015017 [Dermatophagoides farinae]|uniref:Uncharacterized protein n=1 Tax=Dermatophagoides farinae TaxID=6954 RepID=A0A922KZU8_DERFA|nr:hypothetical protein DERF_015017 [Dermatophagoides farinae]